MKNYIVYALLANLLFASGAMFFTHYSKKTSSVWMNTFKALLACVLFFIVTALTTGFHFIDRTSLSFLLISGTIGLGIGDIFLIKAFEDIGPGRTMVLFGFQPLIIGVMSYFFFNQTIDLVKFSAIILFILCIYIFSLEKRAATGKYDIKGISYALIGMLLDGVGIILTRFAFENSSIESSEANAYRALGAVVFFLIFSFVRPFYFFKTLKTFSNKSKMYVTVGAFLGTFASLYVYMMAVKVGHLASVSAIAITSTIFASLFESILYKQLPSKYLVTSFALFSIGFYLMNF
jgi:drug/metabolite transporter (DMT)-like permease